MRSVKIRQVNKESVVIVGPGAIGSFLGAELYNADWEVAFLGKKGPVNHSFAVGRKKYLFKKPSAAFLRNASLVIFVTKGIDLPEAIKMSAPLFSAGVSCLFLGNGLTHTLILGHQHLLEKFRVRLGVVNFGVSEIEKGRFERKGNKSGVLFGPFLPYLDAPTDQEQKLPPLFSWADTIFPIYLGKWLKNATANPLVVYHECQTNGNLLKHRESLKKQFEDVWNLGIELFGAWPRAKTTCWKELLGVLKDTARNENSMWRDAKRGRPTELSLLLGPVTSFPELEFANKIYREVKLKLDSKNQRKLKIGI